MSDSMCGPPTVLMSLAVQLVLPNQRLTNGLAVPGNQTSYQTVHSQTK